MKCFYHSADLDGKCSAAIVLRKHPCCEMIGIDHGQPFPWDDIKDDEVVFMVDFSLQPFVDMVRLNGMCTLTWIDHHKSAITDHCSSVMDGTHVQFAGLASTGLGACALTWQYLFPNDAVPRAVQLLAEYDVWDHHDPECLPFQYGMRLGIEGRKQVDWNLLFDGHGINEIVSGGRTVLQYQKEQDAGHAKHLCFDTTLGELKLLAANTGPSNSKFFDSVWDADKYDAMCLFRWSPSAEKWTVNLFTDKEGLDLGATCKALGGGGHAGGAGFQCAELPFELRAR